MLGDVHPGDLEHFVEVSVEDVEVDKVLPTRKTEKYFFYSNDDSL